MGMYALFIIPYLLMIAVPAVILIRIVIRGLTLPRGLRRGRAAVCGRCSQEVAEITDAAPLPLRCPECGTKYAQAGLLSLGLAKRTRPGMASVIVSWTLLMLGVSAFAAGIVGSIAGINGGTFTANQSFSHTVRAVRTDGSAPTGIAGYEVRFDGDLEFAYGSPVSSGTLELALRPDSGPAVRVEIDPATTAWTIPSTGDTGSSFDRAAARAAFAAAGLDTSPAYIDFEAGELADAVRFVRTSPDQACYSVLGTGSSYNAPITTSGVVTSWYPSSLSVTGQRGGAAGPLRFEFESDTIDANYNGNPSNQAYDGHIEFRFKPAGVGSVATPRTVTEVLITVRPPEGWPVALNYNLDASTGSVAEGQNTDAFVPASDRDAVEKIAEIAGLADGAGSYDPGLRDLIDLIDEVRRNPTIHDNPGSHTHTASQAHATANPAGDGEPDGGLVSARAATQSYGNTSPGFASSFPVAIMITLGACFVIYAAGIVGIAVRRTKIFPDQLVGPQGPPNPSAVGPRLPGHTRAEPLRDPTADPHRDQR